MSAIRFNILHIFFLVALLSSHNNSWAQNNTISGKQLMDTSDYIPFFYDGALNYNLMIAASQGYFSEIDRLIEKGADVNTKTNEGATPLIFAVANNKEKAVISLLKFNPIIDKVTINNETALLIAVKNRNFRITETLIRAGADVNLTDSHGATPLNHASLNGFLEITDLLLYYDAEIDTRSEEGVSPLIASVAAGYADITDLLIQNKASLEIRDNNGFTAFLLAAYYGDTVIMDLLYKKGSDIYATNESRHNALTLSISSGHTDATKYLLRIGNKWVTAENDNFNPYNVASKYRSNETLEILKRNNVPGQLKFNIDQIAITASSRFNQNDFYSGIKFSFKEPYLNGGFVLGCDIKLWYTRILIQNSENLFYQYMDKGALAYAGFFKDFELTNNPGKVNLLLSTSLLSAYSFGNKLKGTNLSHENQFKVIPSVSFKCTKLNFSVITGLEYIKTSYYKDGPLWLRIGCSYNYYFDKVRMKVKPIKW
jgi:ankyrin repeat protein